MIMMVDATTMFRFHLYSGFMSSLSLQLKYRTAHIFPIYCACVREEDEDMNVE